MAERLSEHPMLTYLTFGLPIVLMAIALLFSMSVFVLIVITAWLGTAFIILFLPVASDNGTSQ